MNMIKRIATQLPIHSRLVIAESQVPGEMEISIVRGGQSPRPINMVDLRTTLPDFAVHSTTVSDLDDKQFAELITSMILDFNMKCPL